MATSQNATLSITGRESNIEHIPQQIMLPKVSRACSTVKAEIKGRCSFAAIRYPIDITSKPTLKTMVSSNLSSRMSVSAILKWTFFSADGSTAKMPYISVRNDAEKKYRAIRNRFVGFKTIDFSWEY